MLWAGGRFVTLDPARLHAEALLERDGRIVALGGFRELRAQAPAEPVAELAGVALPGLIDAHGHLALLGEVEEQVDLAGASSADEVFLRLRDVAPKQGWIRGRGWSDIGWTSPPDARALQAVAPGVLITVERIDSHALWVSAAVLAAAGIVRTTPDPPGGRIERGPGGEPTGVLVDRAMDSVERLFPPDTEVILEARLRAAAERCAACGLVAVHDAGVDAAVLRALERLEAQGELPIRVYAMERESDPEVEAVLARGPRLPGPNGLLTLRAVKFFLDGALGSRGAAFFEPYADGQGGRGLLVESFDHLRPRLARRLSAGFQVALHAIGDAANALAIDALEAAQRDAGRWDLRPRIEHAQHLRPTDIARLRRIGAIASMQPSHQRTDWSWARARLGPERWPGSYAWRSMLEAGVPLAFGSDFPIESPHPLLGLQAAALPQHVGDEPVEAVTLDQALHAFTSGAAYAAFEEHEAGVLRPGARCDLTILDRDPREVPLAELASLQVRGTVVNGRPYLR